MGCCWLVDVGMLMLVGYCWWVDIGGLILVG